MGERTRTKSLKTAHPSGTSNRIATLFYATLPFAYSKVTTRLTQTSTQSEVTVSVKKRFHYH
jgi:hypothetical protein